MAPAVGTYSLLLVIMLVSAISGITQRNQRKGYDLPLKGSGPPKTDWRIVSSKRAFTVDPWNATCGVIDRRALKRSPNSLIRLQALLSGDEGPGFDTFGSLLTCPTKPCQRSPKRAKLSHGNLPGDQYCVLDLSPLGCPSRYFLSIRLKRNTSSSRALFETRNMKVLYPMMHINKPGRYMVVVKVDSEASQASVTGGLARTLNVKRQNKTDIQPCTLVYLCHVDILASADNSKNRAQDVLAHQPSHGCPCSPNLPAACPNQPLLPPTPFWWVSRPSVEHFSVTIHLVQEVQVFRLNISLGTAPPRGDLTVQTEADKRWTTHLIFSPACPFNSPTEVACVKPPKFPWRGSVVLPALWLLTSGNIKCSPTKRMRLLFNGFPKTHPLTQKDSISHVIVDVKVYVPYDSNNNNNNNNKRTTTITNNKNNNDNSTADTRNIPYPDEEPLLEYAILDQAIDSDIIRKGRVWDLLRKAGKVKRDTGTNSEPKVTRISPLSGPEAGVVVNIEGMNLGPPNLTITVGNKRCHCSKNIMNTSQSFRNGCNTDSYAVCLLINGSGLIGQALPVRIQTHNGTEVVFEINNTFVFKPNPVVYDVSPQTSYMSGGRTVTLLGENLDVGVNPRLILTTIFGDDATKYDPQYSDPPCTVTNSTFITCKTPDVTGSIPKSYQMRKKRALPENFEPGFYINDPTLGIKIGFRTALYARNVTDADGNMLEMHISRDPKYRDFQNDRFELRFYELSDPKIVIEDTRSKLTNAAEKEDYIVTVGGLPCNVTELLSNILKCTPPKESDIPDHVENAHVRDDDGNPRVQVHVGFQPPSSPGVAVYQYSKPIDLPPILGGLAAALFVIIVIALLICWWRRERDDPLLHKDYRVLVRDGYALLDLIPESLREKISSKTLEVNSIEVGDEIGHGHFGTVHKGRRLPFTSEAGTHNRGYDVAIKTLKDEGVSKSELQDFLDEAIIMKDFKHKNVLDLIGVFIKDNRPYVVLPYMANGDLKSYVSKQDRKIKLPRLLWMLVQVADGMDYIYKQGTVHRDLRAANCLVDANEEVKVADFGLARIMERDYYRIQDVDRALPRKWMAPEVLEYYKFTVYSDVWSFGVLMWEVLTKGGSPFTEVDARYMKRYLVQGHRLERPPTCPNEVYDVMMKCWERDPDRRPHFDDLSKMLEALKNKARDTTVRKDDPEYLEILRRQNSDNGYLVPGKKSEYLSVRASNEYTKAYDHMRPSFREKIEQDSKANGGVHTEHAENYVNSIVHKRAQDADRPMSDQYALMPETGELAESEYVYQGPELFAVNEEDEQNTTPDNTNQTTLKKTNSEEAEHDQNMVSDEANQTTSKKVMSKEAEDDETMTPNYTNQPTFKKRRPKLKEDERNTNPEYTNQDTVKEGTQAANNGENNDPDFKNQPKFKKRAIKKR